MIPHKTNRLSPISVEQIISLNKSNLPTDRYKLLDREKLEGALAAPFQIFNNQLLFPTPYLRSAKLVESIATAHAFLDGNKRTAWGAGVILLKMSGKLVEESFTGCQDDLIVNLVEHTISVEDLANWMLTNSQMI